MTGAELKALRKGMRFQGQRVRQVDLARRLGVTPFTISRWEHGRTIPRDQEERIRKALGQVVCPACGRAYEEGRG